MSYIFFYLAMRRWRVKLEDPHQKPVSLVRAVEGSQPQPEPYLTATAPSSITDRPKPQQPVKIKVFVKTRGPAMLTTGYTFPASVPAEESPDVVQVDVAFLSYTTEGEHNGNARLDTISYVTYKDLLAHEAAKRRQKGEMGKNAYKHFKWYIKALKEELAVLGPNRKFKIVHWLISSRNVPAFMIKSEFFPAISIIIAPKKEHWYAALGTEEGRSKYGTRNRTPQGDSLQDNAVVPTYIRCRDDYCANNCVLCQSSKNCICYLQKRRSFHMEPAIDEELEDLV